MLDHLVCMFGSLVIGVATAWFLFRSEVAELQQNFERRMQEFLKLGPVTLGTGHDEVTLESKYKGSLLRIRTLEVQAKMLEGTHARLRAEADQASHHKFEAEQSMLLIREWERKFNVANAQLVSLDHLNAKKAS